MATMFAKGEEVLARHPQSRDFNKGKVVDVKGSSYRVMFPDGEFTISAKDVKNKRSSRSATRSKSGKSPSRTSPSRKKSPGRPKTRSPARSPARVRKVKPVIETKLAKISIPRIDSDRDYADETSTTDATESLEGSDLLPLQSRLKELRPVGVRRSTRLQLATPKIENRATSLPLERKYIKDDKERGFSMHKDREPSLLKERDDALEMISDKNKVDMSLMTHMMKPHEWGGWIGALFLILLMPIVFIAPQIVCTNNRCRSTFSGLTKDWRIFFNVNAFYAYAGYIFAVCLLSVIPIGKVVYSEQSKIGKLQYRINGFLSAFVILAAFAGSIYKGYKISNFILENMLQLAVCGWIYGALLALVLYVKSRKAPIVNQNIYGSSNKFVYDFWQGREINPRLGPIDFKIVLRRVAFIGSALINAAVLAKMWERNNSPTFLNDHIILLIALTMQALYLFDFFLFESASLTTFEITQEGTGYMLTVGYLMYPFISTLQTRFLLYNKFPVSLYTLIPCIIAFKAGYLIYRNSNNEKDAFRRNPFSPHVSHLHTISTSRGKKLIVSGLWGYVRHPNYFGDLTLHWASALMILVPDVIPYFCAIIRTLSLLSRALRDNARCQSRYNIAWNEYCSRVKYMIVKKIF